MKKGLFISLDKFIKSSVSSKIDYKCNLSVTLLNFLLDSTNDSYCTIDLLECSDYSFIFNEIFNFFDIRFPKRIKITNY